MMTLLRSAVLAAAVLIAPICMATNFILLPNKTIINTDNINAIIVEPKTIAVDSVGNEIKQEKLIIGFTNGPILTLDPVYFDFFVKELVKEKTDGN